MRKVLHWIHCRVWGVIVLVLGLALLPALCLGQQVLNYTGQVMTGNIVDGQLQITQATTETATLQLVLPQPLAPNAANQTVVPVTWMLNFSGMAQALTTATFTFTTVNGTITAWNLSFYATDGSAISTLELTDGGDSYVESFYIASCGQAVYQFPLCSTTTTSNTTAGTWTDPMAAITNAKVQSLQAQLATATTMETTYRNGYVGWAEDAAQYKTWLLEEISNLAACQKKL